MAHGRGIEMDTPHTPRRHVIIGIIGSGKASAHDQSGYTLLSGGGAGVMM